MTEREMLPEAEERSTDSRFSNAPKSLPDPGKRSMIIIIALSVVVALLGFGLIILLTVL